MWQRYGKHVLQPRHRWSQSVLRSLALTLTSILVLAARPLTSRIVRFSNIRLRYKVLCLQASLPTEKPNIIEDNMTSFCSWTGLDWTKKRCSYSNISSYLAQKTCQAAMSTTQPTQLTESPPRNVDALAAAHIPHLVKLASVVISRTSLPHTRYQSDPK